MLSFVLAAAVGVNVHLPPNDTLDLAGDLGVEWIRIDFNWNLVEQEDDVFQWGEFDRVIDAAEARGLKVFATVGYGPAWASTGDRMGDGNHNDVPVAAELTEFVTAAVTRYATRVDAWGTWNEPNLGDFFEGSRQEWIDNAFVPTVDAIRAACASCLIAAPRWRRSASTTRSSSRPPSTPAAASSTRSRGTSTPGSPRRTPATASRPTATTTSSSRTA